MRVLIVDDEGSVLVTLAANLELEGFEVASAPSGERALEMLREQAFDLVLTDIRMPRMNGVELFRRVRAIHPAMPVVLMTAYAVEGLVEEALGEGAFAVLPKPFAIDHVAATLLRAARRPVVLIVDETEAETTAAALRASGVGARAAIDEESAVRAVQDGAVDVCVLPAEMRAKPGDTSIRRSAPDCMEALLSVEPALTFILIAGTVVSDVVRRVTALGAFACLRGPVGTREIIRVVARARSARPRPSAQPPAGAH